MAPHGRPRDSSLDEAILDAARDHLAAHGYEAMSLVSVARSAGTTRQALYRRWASKADLATAAIARLAAEDPVPVTDDPFADLVAELAGFQRGVSRPNGVSLVGSMLQSGTDPELLDRYRARVVAPRRHRLVSILERARDDGRLPADTELSFAAAAGTGSYYAAALAGDDLDPTWPRRAAEVVWRACGGEPPTPV